MTSSCNTLTCPKYARTPVCFFEEHSSEGRIDLEQKSVFQFDDTAIDELVGDPKKLGWSTWLIVTNGLTFIFSGPHVVVSLKKCSPYIRNEEVSRF